MLTQGKGRGRAPWLLLTLLLCCALTVSLGAAAPAFALNLSGTVANDVNGNGVLDAMDAPLGGISVTVQPAGGGIAARHVDHGERNVQLHRPRCAKLHGHCRTVMGLLNGTPGSVTVALNSDLNNVNFLFTVPG